MTRFSNVLRWSSLIVLIAVLSACSTARTSNLYETFFVGTGISQYFVKPLEMENDDYEMSIDFTIRQQSGEEPVTITNFSFFSESPVSNIDSLELNGDEKQIIRNIERLFFEKQGDEYVIRSTMNPDFEFVRNFFQSNNLTITVYFKGGHAVFQSGSSLNDKRHQIYYDLIKLVEMDME